MTMLLFSLQIILLAVLTASLSCAFHHFTGYGMIFNSYAKWLLSFDKGEGLYWKKYISKNQTRFGLIMYYLSKPLGLCPYCNGTWVAIFYYILWFKTVDFNLFLLIGVNWLFIHAILKKLPV